MAPVGEAATTWASALDLLASKKTDDARKLGENAQAKGNDSGVKMTEASGAIVVAMALLCKTNAQPGSDFVDALKSVEATWSEAAALLAGNGSGGVTGTWGKAADSAKSLASKASGEAKSALTSAMTLAKEVGITWTEKLTAVSAHDLSSATSEDEATLKAAASAPSSITDPKQKAPALVRAALAQMKMEHPQTEDALKNAKEALALFREINDFEGEGTALRTVSVASFGTDAFGALQAANQSLKTFKELGHTKGQAAAIHAIAKAHMGKDSTDDAIFRAGEALKLSRQVGDRMREAAVLDLIAEANLVMGGGKKALTAAQDALAVAKSLGEKVMEAQCHCLLAKAQGTCGEAAAAAGIQSAQDALALYQSLGLKDKESQALTAMAAACKGKNDPTEALRCGQELTDKFRQANDKKNEAACMYGVAGIHLSSKELEQALRGAQEAAACYKLAGDRMGEAKALNLLAQVRILKEEPGDAVKAAEQACMLYRSGAVGGRAIRDAELKSIKSQVDAHAMMGGIDEAMRLASEQQRRFKSSKEKKGEGSCLLMLAKLHQMRGESDDALNALVQAPSLFLAVGDRRGEAEAWQQIAKIHLSKGQAQQAQRAAEECSLAYRKLGDKRGRAVAAQLVADVHFALASLGAGNPQEALKAAQEAASLFQELDEKASLAVALHILCNAQLMTKSFEDALKTAQDAETQFRALRDGAGEAGSLLLQAGAHLGEKNFEECKRCAKECKDLFKSAGDVMGEDSVEDFLDIIAAYEKGQQNVDDFRGFSMRTDMPAVAQKGGQKASRQPRKNRSQMSNIADIELIKAEASKESKLTLAFFDGFESRAAGAGARPDKGGKDKGGLKDSLESGHGYPQKEQVLYSVRWVQASQGKSGAGLQPRRGGNREFIKEEDQRVVTAGDLGAPKENWGSRYSQSDRIQQGNGGRSGL